MHSYQSRWEELFTNQQGQVMTNFKLDNWVIMPNDPDKRSLAQVKQTYTESNKVKLYWPSENSVAVCSEMTHYELWQPKPDEWCWFLNHKNDIPRLRKFISASNPFDRPTVYTTHPDPATEMSRAYCGIESYKYCEAFIGQLPTILKDK